MTPKTKTLLRVLAAQACALIVAGYFIYAAYPKIREPRQFRVDILNYRMLPEQYSYAAALFLPWLEAISALALLIPGTRRAGAVMISGLLYVFIVALYYAAIHLGLDINCGCTGEGSSMAGWASIDRNLVLLTGTILSVLLLGRRSAQVAGGPAFPVVTAAAAEPPARPNSDTSRLPHGATDVARSVRMSPRTGPR